MPRKKQESDYYSLDPILKKGKDCKYYLIYGQRSNGKTYAVLKHMMEEYFSDRKQCAIIRRFREDFIGKRGRTMFDNLLPLIPKMSNDVYNGIKYLSMQWFFVRYDEEGNVELQDEKPFCYGFAISEGEHDKSSSYPGVKNILFDEFISRSSYLPEEFVDFMNVLSTIIRNKNDAKVFMCGNTINKYCPYFKEMGIKHYKEMKKGDIDIYTYANRDLRVAVEWAEAAPATRKSSAFFAFDNPKLSMITQGDWELDIFPHAPCKIKNNQIKFRFFINWDDGCYEGDLVRIPEKHMEFIFIHEKTTPIKNPESDIIFSSEFSAKRNHFRSIKKNYNPVVHKLGLMFSAERVFYQNNEVGNVIQNYLEFCDTV